MRPEQWVIVDTLAPIILKHVRGDILEIGMGGSTDVLIKHAKLNSRNLFSCDIDQRKCVKKTSFHKVFCLPSIAFIEYMKDKQTGPSGKLALGIIDGDHSSSVLGPELTYFASRDVLASGGVIFLHDTNLYDRRRKIDAFCVKEQYEQDPNYDVFTWPYTASSCGLTMIAHRDPKGPFYRR